MDEIFTLLFINTKLLLNSSNGGLLMSFFKETIQLIFQSITCIVGIVGILAFFFRGRLKTLKAIKTMANTANSFMAKIVPDILQGFEKKEFIPKGTLADWAKIIGSEMCIIKSPRQLNERGEQLLNDSGIKKAIDQNLKMLLEKLERKKPQNLLDVEKYAFYVLRDEEDESVTNYT